MKTLGEYSRHCREIDDVLKQAVNGIGSVYPLSETAMLCYILEHDGMVVIDYVDVNVGSKKKPIVRQDIVSGYSHFCQRKSPLCFGMVCYKVLQVHLYLL